MRDPSGEAGSALDRRDVLWVAALVLAFGFLFFWKSWSYTLWDPWEPKYAGTVAEMLARGDFVTPWFDDHIRWTKPILTYWSMLVPIALFGNHEFTARLPMMLAGTCGVAALYLFLRRLRGRATGLVAAAVLGTSPQYFYLARQAMPDMLLALFLGCAMGFFALARFDGGARRRNLLAFYASVALAFLTKGPVAPALVAGALAIFWSFDLRERLGSLRGLVSWVAGGLSRHHVMAGALVFLAIAGPWYGTMLARHGADFLDHFFGDENLERFAEPLRGHFGGAETYVGTLFHGMYPWIGLLPLGALFLFHGVGTANEEARQRWYFASWFVAAFLLFTIAATKLDHYVFPIVMPAAVLIALVWEAYLCSDPPGWVRPVLASSALFVLLPVRDFLVEGSVFLFDVFSTKRDLEYPTLEIALLALLGAWTAIAVAGWFVPRSRVVVSAAVLVAFGHAVYFSHFVLPDHAKHRSLRAYVEHYQDVREPDAELVFYGWMHHTLYYYLGKDNFRQYAIDEEAALARHVATRRHVYLIVQTDFAERLMPRLRRERGATWVPVETPIEHVRFRLLKKVPAHPFAPELQRDWWSE